MKNIAYEVISETTLVNVFSRKRKALKEIKKLEKKGFKKVYLLKRLQNGKIKN